VYFTVPESTNQVDIFDESEYNPAAAEVISPAATVVALPHDAGDPE
jgi:hypothetical protein